jgi:kinetochore protein Mis12/MTW1
VRPPELRDWIRLSHYEGLDFSRRDGADAGNLPRDTPTVESITALRRRLRESMRLNALLTAERARNEALLEDLRRLVGDPASTNPQVKTESASPAQGRSARNRADAATNTNTAGNPGQSGSGDGVDAPKRGETGGPFAFLHQKGDLASSGGGAAPLETTAAFTLSQMQALRALSTALSNVMPDLKTSSTAETVLEEDDHGSGTRLPRSWRRERAEYVESATRRHLETVQGLELGKHGEVRDGEWQGPGRNLAAGEVEGLEQVVAMLGGGNGVDSTAAGPSSLGPTEQGDEERMDES